VRRAAAGAVGKLGIKEAVGDLLKLAGDSDIEMRGNCLDSLRLLREPRVLKFAAPALNDAALEMKALACYAELGGPSDAKLIVDLAKRHPSNDVVATSIRALVAWRDRDATSDKETLDLYRGIAEIHGAGGILVHWDVSVPYNAGGRDGIVKAMGVPGKRTKFWHTQFSSGAEGRLALQPVGGDQKGRYLFTEIDAAAESPVEFLASSRNTLDVWLNGKSIHRRAMPGKFQIDSDRFAATLQPGLNRVLVDAGPADMPIDFHLRFRRKSSKAAHEKLTQAALSRTGNAERGRKVYFDKEKSQCMKCHQLAGQGERIGPELTGVGGRFSRIYLVESILEPSRTIAPSFGAWTISLKNGKQVNGIKLADDVKTLTIADNQGMKHVLAKADIDEQNPSAVSTMPEGLEIRLTEDEFVDLIGFLANQR
jgi:putative heme-binding domain-containing protein